MRITKKLIVTLFMTFSISMSMFSQSPSFREHLEKAKQYEIEKLWIHALGEYYDAMEIVPTDNAKDVFQCWKNLAETIESGNPGYGKFNDFDFVENWIFLLQEYEKYWTHTAPKTFYFEKPERIELNREKRTATYKFGIKLIKTGKFKEIDAIVQKGFKKAYKEDWNIDFLKNWPQESIYNDKKYGDKYLIEDTALTSVKLARLNNRNYSPFDEERNYSPVKKDSGEHHLFGSGLGYTVANEFQYSKKSPAFSCSVSTWTHIENTDYWAKDGSASLYDIKFHIADRAGNVLLQSTRYNILYETRKDLRYEFKDVPQKAMELIEDGEVDIVIDEVYLEYGKLDSYAITGNRSYLKNLPELRIDNYTLNSWISQKNDESIVPNLKQTILEYERNKKEFEEALEEHLQYRDAVIHKGLEEKSYFHMEMNCVLKSMPSIYLPGAYWNKLCKKYGSENAETVYYYLFCNKLSELENLEPVYKLQHQNATYKNYESEDVLFLENFENLVCDTSASGWRLPTKSEDHVREITYKWYDLSTETETERLLSGRCIIRNGDKEKVQFDKKQIEKENKKREQEYNEALAYFEKKISLAIGSEERFLVGNSNILIKGNKKIKPFVISCIYLEYKHPHYDPYHAPDYESQLHKILKEKYSEKCLDNIFLYYACNEKSKYENLSPCYSLKNSNEQMSAESFLENYDKIICDSNQNGWRAATQEEIEFALKKNAQYSAILKSLQTREDIVLIVRDVK